MADDKKVKNPSEKLKEATKIASKAKQQNHVYNDVEEAVLRFIAIFRLLSISCSFRADILQYLRYCWHCFFMHRST